MRPVDDDVKDWNQTAEQAVVARLRRETRRNEPLSIARP